MTLHTDIPARAEVDRLLESRHAASVSLYVPTDPASPGNPETTADAELVARARSVLDGLHAEELGRIRELLERRRSQARAATDVVDVARAATAGAVECVLVDIDQTVPGAVDDQTGAVTFSETDDAVAYGVTDEIARRVWLTGGRVLAVRGQDIPGEGPVAAILRYAL